MDIFLIILEAVLVLLGIGVIGFWITRRGIIPETAHGLILRLAIDIALPCLVFANILTNFSPKELPDWWQLPLWWFLFAAISFVLMLVTKYVSNKDTRSEFAINLFYQNGLFFPLIVISGVFGTDAPYLPQLYIFIILHPIMFLSTYNFFFKSRRGKLKWNRIYNPIIIAVILAVTLQLFGTRNYVPDFIYSILQTLGAMALPLIMIILGGSLYLDVKQKGKLYFVEIVKFIIIKNVVFPFAFLGILILLDLYYSISYSIALLFVLESAVPPVTATPILTERAGGNKPISTQFVFSSFIFSVVSIPVIFSVFSKFFPTP
ncbi:AEC family transporter [Chloroflexota bacterium]